MRGAKGELNPNWRGTDIGYTGAHMRVRRNRGPATEQICECGAPADEWSYDGNDPEELTQEVGGFWVPFSADPSHYVPQCRSCHRKQNAPPPRTHCPHGHEYTPENTGYQHGKRRCLTCHRIQENARYHARKAATV